jgi:hypothetical protein
MGDRCRTGFRLPPRPVCVAAHPARAPFHSDSTTDATMTPELLPLGCAPWMVLLSFVLSDIGAYSALPGTGVSQVAASTMCTTRPRTSQ